jgi:hypothetical protein
MRIIGIDPGKSGGIAYFDTDNSKMYAYAMPESEKEITKTIIDIFMQEPGIEAKVYLEKVHSMPQQGVVSTFTFGQGYGFIRGVLSTVNDIGGNNYPLFDIRPQAWQKALEIPKRNINTESYEDFKKRLVVTANQWFPYLPVTKKTADAILIAYYGYRHHLGIERSKDEVAA